MISFPVDYNARKEAQNFRCVDVVELKTKEEVQSALLLGMPVSKKVHSSHRWGHTLLEDK